MNMFDMLLARNLSGGGGGGGGSEPIVLHVNFTMPEGVNNEMQVVGTAFKVNGQYVMGTDGASYTPITVTGAGDHTFDVYGFAPMPVPETDPTEYANSVYVWIYDSVGTVATLDPENSTCDYATFNPNTWVYVFDEGKTEATLNVVFKTP